MPGEGFSELSSRQACAVPCVLPKVSAWVRQVLGQSIASNLRGRRIRGTNRRHSLHKNSRSRGKRRITMGYEDEVRCRIASGGTGRGRLVPLAHPHT